MAKGAGVLTDDTVNAERPGRAWFTKKTITKNVLLRHVIVKSGEHYIKKTRNYTIQCAQGHLHTRPRGRLEGAATPSGWLHEKK